MTAIMDFAFQLFCLLTLEPPAVILACENYTATSHRSRPAAVFAGRLVLFLQIKSSGDYIFLFNNGCSLSNAVTG